MTYVTRLKVLVLLLYQKPSIVRSTRHDMQLKLIVFLLELWSTVPDFAYGLNF